MQLKPGTVEVEVLLYVHRNRRLIRDGEPRTATSTFTQLLTALVGAVTYVCVINCESA